MAGSASDLGLEATAKRVEARGIMTEDKDQIYQRLLLACQGVAAEQSDLALKDHLLPFLDHVKAALHKEFCDPEKKALREAYQKHFASAMTTEGVAAVAAVVAKVIVVINPAFAVSSVAVYMALWVMKVGINYWCSLPAPTQA
jgi:hypothetical protein